MGSLIALDTSAIYALMAENDDAHDEAKRISATLSWSRVVTHNYVVTEAISILDRRGGQEVVARLLDGILRSVMVEWVDRDLHERGLAAFLGRERRKLSFVDAVTIEFCRERGIREVFAFDDDLERAGLKALRV
jgi:predicted nucleic acid-binding protein